jgi:hypothetical protein
MTRDPRRQTYEIRVRGHLGPKMLRAFEALSAQLDGEDTLLRGFLPDQAALYGVIARLEALGLELVELRCLAGCAEDQPPPPLPAPLPPPLPAPPPSPAPSPGSRPARRSR